MRKPQPANLEAERRAVADKDLQAYCDVVITRAAELMVEQNAPLEMILDRFRSAKGSMYNCSIEGNKVVLNWRSDSGGMSSRSTTFEAADQLTITSDMSSKVFNK